MSTEMKSKRDVREMKRGRRLQVVLLLLSLVLLSLPIVTLARPERPGRAMLDGCADVKVCLQQIIKKISGLRAYVRHVKPGDPVEFNPQPDPPGDPDPWYRQGLEAYKSLQREFSDLAESSPWGRAKWTWSENQISAWKKTVGEAQERLGRLGHSSDRNAANMTLNDLSVAVQRLSRMLSSRSR